MIRAGHAAARATDFAALLEAQRREYGAVLPRKVAKLVALAREAVDCGGRPDALRALEREAHTLAGTSGTFGFIATSQAARALLSAAVEAQLPSRGPAQATIRRLQLLIAELLACKELA